MFAADTDAEFASHHWPHWGRDEVRRHLCTQRDAYRYLHDQTMRRANRGETPREIAEDFAMPPTLAGLYTLRGYYGTVSHNVKAVYQRYLGWFDANPANLHPLPPVEAGARYVECMGGADEVLRKARASFDAGDYRWTAELLNHLVFADPTRAEARALQADTLEQLGYQAESGPWRDFYLTGAQELRQGAPMLPPMLGANLEMLRAMTTGMLLDLLGVRLDGPRAAAAVAADGPIALNLVVSGEPWFVELSNGALHAVAGRHDERADVTVTLDRGALAEVASGVQPGALHAVDITGHRETFDRLLALLDSFTMGFPIVEP